MFLKENIQNAQNGDQHALIGLVEKFRPLMLNLAKKINDEDAFPNIQAVFIELIQHLKLAEMRKTDDPTLLLYIKRTMHNAALDYCKLLSRDQHCVPFSALACEDSGDQENSIMDKLGYTQDEYIQIQLDFLKKSLTQHEAEVIIYHYQLKYTIKEIASFYGVTMSAVSQTKANAIKKLRQKMEG